jgi:hypothetical protein
MKAKRQITAILSVLIPTLLTSLGFAQGPTSTKTNSNSLKLSLKEDLGFGAKKTLLKGRNTVSILDDNKKDKDNGKPSRTGGRRMIVESQKQRFANTEHSRVRLAIPTRPGRIQRLGSPGLDVPSKHTSRVVYSTRKRTN